MEPATGHLVVLRGNSGSGKSTVARLVQRRFAAGRCAVVSQDLVRRNILRERDTPGAFNIALIETIAASCLDRAMVVVVEGILDADRYGPMLERLSHGSSRENFYAWDLSFEETARRHQLRPEATEFTVDDMREWYHGWQPLPFAEEARIDAMWSVSDAVERVCSDLAKASTPSARFGSARSGMRAL